MAGDYGFDPLNLQDKIADQWIETAKVSLAKSALGVRVSGFGVRVDRDRQGRPRQANPTRTPTLTPTLTPYLHPNPDP